MMRTGIPSLWLVFLLACGSWTVQPSFALSALSPPPANGNSLSDFSNLDPPLSSQVKQASKAVVRDADIGVASAINTATGLASAGQAAQTSSSLNTNIAPPTITPTTTPTTTTTTTTHAAIVLNTNARSVSADLVPVAESIFGKDYVYVTNTEEEGKEAATKLMERDDINMIIPVGGDGTLASMINFLCDAIRAKNSATMTIEDAMKKLPYIAYVPLGTGNGVGSVVGSEMLSNPPWKILFQKRRKRRQMRQALEAYYDVAQKLNENPDYLKTDESKYDVVDLPMMQVSYPEDDSEIHKDTLCFFAGAGFDSLMLQDFQNVKKWAIRTKILTKTLSSVAGYCVALILKTLPKCVARQEHNIDVKVTTRDPDTLWIDHRRGDVVQSVGPTTTNSHKGRDETLIYKGSTGILAAGTSPFYGGGLRLFPFARLTKDKMHLRLGRIHPLRGFFNIPQIFEGSFRDKGSSSFGCLDFIGGDFDVHITSTIASPSPSKTSAPAITDGSANSTSSDSDVDVDAEVPQKGFPVQHSGESAGYFEHFRLRVVKIPVRFVTLMEKRVVRE